MPRARSLHAPDVVFEQKGAWDYAISTAASTCIAQTRRALEERAVAALLPPARSGGLRPLHDVPNCNAAV